jgi:hypothetical protein
MTSNVFNHGIQSSFQSFRSPEFNTGEKVRIVLGQPSLYQIFIPSLFIQLDMLDVPTESLGQLGSNL